MKKSTAIILVLCLTAALSACGSGEIYIHESAATPEPKAGAEATAVPETSESRIEDELGAPVILNIHNLSDSFPAPDGSDHVILTYGYDDLDVYLESNHAAAEAINQFLATEDEIYYTGSGNGDGMNAMLELAMDNYAMALEHETETNLAFSCMRVAFVDRSDSRVIAVRYRVNSYTGGAHGLYTDRAYVFDTSSGRLLGFDDLATDRAMLEQFLLDRMDQVLQNDVRYQPVFDYLSAFYPDGDLNEQLKNLFRDGSWTLNEEGLVVFSDLYEIGSYADGIVRFVVPYEELNGLINEAWMPVERIAGGEIHIMGIHDAGSREVRLLDKVFVSDNGSEFRVFAEGTVYDVSVSSVIYVNDDVGFYQTYTHWHCSYLSDLGVQIQTEIPDGMPNLMIRYCDADGTVHSFLVTESGEDGSVLLLEEDRVVAVG